jgi:hypothetical protein
MNKTKRNNLYLFIVEEDIECQFIQSGNCIKIKGVIIPLFIGSYRVSIHRCELLSTVFFAMYIPT